MKLQVKGITKEYAQVDIRTGEVIDHEKQFRILHKRVSDTITVAPWSRMFDGAVFALAQLSRVQIVVMLSLVKYSDPLNMVRLSQTQRKTISSAAGVGRQAVNNAISGLIKSGNYIRAEDRNQYFLNPYLFWRGTENQLLEAIKSWEEPRLPK